MAVLITDLRVEGNLRGRREYSRIEGGDGANSRAAELIPAGGVPRRPEMMFREAGAQLA